MKSLSNVLRDVEDIVPQRDLTSQQKDELDEVARGCCNVLNEFNRTLDKYQGLDSSAKGMSGKSRRFLEKISMGSEGDRPISKPNHLEY